jgi:threonine dehydrogenase-like Zn-dependent dehydrogenase
MTDVHIHDDGNIGKIVVTPETPNVIGHEFSGVVIKTGSDGAKLKAGL